MEDPPFLMVFYKEKPGDFPWLYVSLPEGIPLFNQVFPLFIGDMRLIFLTS